jgi:hydroxypyruvate reductase
MQIGQEIQTARQNMMEIFQYAFQASRVEQAIDERILFDGEMMEIDGFRYDLGRFDRCVLISLGKAAEPMLSSFLARSGNAAERFEGVVVAPDPVALPSDRFTKFQAGHPSPNAASISAAEEILRMLSELGESDFVIFLISGGGSSLVEQFLQPDTPLEVIAATHKALVESAAPITAINTVRKHLSSVKGGRLAAAAAPAEQLTIAVSDVPAGRLDALSSGPTIPDESTLADVYAAVEQYGLMARLPREVAAQLAARSLEETPKRGELIFTRSRWSVLLDSSSLEEAAGRRAAELGWHVVVDNTCDDWSADKAAAYLVARLQELREKWERVCLISSGEVTVTVPHRVSGSGGRNQHFALEASRLIAGETITVLSVGSDGVDGNSPAAGGVVDGTSVERATRVGYPIEEALATFNSYPLLSKLQDAIVTGPTGNNLRDLRILLAP